MSFVQKTSKAAMLLCNSLSSTLWQRDLKTVQTSAFDYFAKVYLFLFKVISGWQVALQALSIKCHVRAYVTWWRGRDESSQQRRNFNKLLERRNLSNAEIGEPENGKVSFLVALTGPPYLYVNCIEAIAVQWTTVQTWSIHSIINDRWYSRLSKLCSLTVTTRLSNIPVMYCDKEFRQWVSEKRNLDFQVGFVIPFYLYQLQTFPFENDTSSFAIHLFYDQTQDSSHLLHLHLLRPPVHTFVWLLLMTSYRIFLSPTHQSSQEPEIDVSQLEQLALPQACSPYIHQQMDFNEEMLEAQAKTWSL